MKIYLAACYSRRVELLGYRAELEAMGYVVTSRWLNGSHQISSSGVPIGDSGEALIEGDDGGQSEEAKRLRQSFAQEDVADLDEATVIIAFTEPPRSTASRGGRHVEFGVALGWSMSDGDYRLIVVGYRENLFHWLPAVEFYATWEEAKAALSKSRWRAW